MSRSSIRFPYRSSDLDPAAPVEMASSHFATSSPALCAYTMPSTSPTMVDAIAIWLPSFARCPAPGPPMYSAFPISLNRGARRATTAASPPAKMESVALRAPRSPPETGASTAAQLLAAAASAISAARVGSEVVMSTSNPPGARPARAPVEGSREVERTSEGKPTMRKMTSAAAAAARGLSARVAPRETSPSALEAVRL
ncbi:Os01g0742350 [Oryza sativa Japonica Group]|uniref:Os01g0742350 protein n=2 Tax=Oryza sativa subsp. japonica TaxID=39947 RepID=C7IY07_ORYSJ|nr:hypothetical protein EE612_005646 [Oryza sativa]BAH91293.1 Os01g0742350 [Oryza sativa Japonica Group]BAS74285.1 Os01g0742350 [Oryza sativa Japonica Group]|eukprot:NP_001172563.1 Os01g0742350 [Oryza sativa Japonica Group]